jgi:anti-sigma factor RsiW
MNRCEEYNTELLLYLDNELTGEKFENFQAHLLSCADCRERLEEELALSSVLRRTRPLYLAPDALRERVAAAAVQQDFVSTGQSVNSGETELQTWLRRLQSIVQPIFSWKTLAFTITVFVLGLIFLPEFVQRSRASEYVETAIATHRNYLNGDLPLEIRSGSPKEVTAWFAGRVPFDFQLPAAPTTPNGKPAYRLTGGRLVNYKNSHVALVTYEMPSEKISLLVASSKYAVAAGGEEVRSGNLTFHYRSRANFKVITWTNHGLTYALVSSLKGSAQHSCLVCHQN